MTDARLRLSRALKWAMMRYIPLMITCRDFDALLHDYVEGSLTAGLRRRIQIHCMFCRECSDYLLGYQQTIKLEKTVPVDDGDVPESFVQAVLSARRA